MREPAVEEALVRLGRLKQSSDREVAHKDADELLAALIRRYVPDGKDIIEAYDHNERWYA